MLQYVLTITKLILPSAILFSTLLAVAPRGSEAFSHMVRFNMSLANLDILLTGITQDSCK